MHCIRPKVLPASKPAFNISIADNAHARASHAMLPFTSMQKLINQTTAQ
jgi:hypothetical protein